MARSNKKGTLIHLQLNIRAFKTPAGHFEFDPTKSTVTEKYSQGTLPDGKCYLYSINYE